MPSLKFLVLNALAPLREHGDYALCLLQNTVFLDCLVEFIVIQHLLLCITPIQQEVRGSSVLLHLEQLLVVIKLLEGLCLGRRDVLGPYLLLEIE